jgi:YVTN family beta-propeller protein
MNPFMKRASFSTGRAILCAVLLVGLFATAALAQIGGPKDIKRTASAAKAPASVSGSYEHQGIRLDFTMEPTGESRNGLVAGADALVTFRVSDAHTGQPLSGIRPSAWISARKMQNPPSEEECKDKIRTFMGGLLSARPDIDLNSYLLLTLNHDKTISVINPQIKFTRTQLESLITLPGTGADWALSKGNELLFVTMPAESAIAVINTVTRKVVSTIPTGEGTRPMRIALQPDGRYVWVGLDNSPRVLVIDAEKAQVVANIEVGAGLHQLAFTADSRFAYVTNSASDTVSAIGIEKLAKVADIPVGKTPVPVAYSSANHLIYVAAINGDSLSVIDPTRQQVVKKIKTERGVVALRFAPGGRFGFAVNQVTNRVAVVDAATDTVAGSVEVVKGPDQVTFTDRFAYIRGTGSEKFSIIELSGLTKSKFVAVDITAGQKPASAMPAEIGVADMIAPTPEGNAAMVASAPDQMIYYYVEGMMAPMGTLQNYKRRPRAIMMLDRSLAEVSTGVYTTTVKLKTGGRFDVSVLTGQPRLTRCFQLEVADSPDAERTFTGVPVAVKALFEGQQFKTGQTAALRFRLTDPVTGEPLKGLTDVQVLAFEPPGIWQQRQWAREVGDGEYEISQIFPRPGQYRVMVRTATRGASFADLPFTTIPVVSGIDFISSESTDR